MTRPAHIAPAPFPEVRHPRCIKPTPAAGTPIGDAAVIHDLRNQLFRATAALGLVAITLGLPEDAAGASILERVQKLADVEADRDGLLEVLGSITAAAGLPEGCEVDKLIQRIAAAKATP